MSSLPKKLVAHECQIVGMIWGNFIVNYLQNTTRYCKLENGIANYSYLRTCTLNLVNFVSTKGSK